ncbi:MAG: AEC family transporter [Planctomycetaceae bacterium]|jgi:predicted permease|nr:AEC family transporter [Planctomycetaceae bacterium]
MFHTFSVALAAILSVFCIVGTGIFFRRSGRLTPESEQPLLRLTVDLLMPCLIFDRVLRTDAFVTNPQNLWLPPILGFSLVAVGILLALAVGFLPTRHNGLATWKQRCTFAGCVGNYNYGFVPIPLVIALFPGDTRILGVLFVQNLGVEIAVWTIVLFTLLGKIDRNSLRHLINGPSIAIVLAVSLNLLGHSRFIPAVFYEHVEPCFDFLWMTIHLLGSASIPMSIILIGTIFADHFHWSEIKEQLSPTLKIAFWSILLRLVVMPAIFVALAVWLPCTREIKQILVIHGAVGSAIFTMALAKHYGGDPKTAFDTILGNSIPSALTLPIWVTFGLSIV